MGTEESIFSIMLYRNKELIDYFEIECNGLMNTFFENLKNNELTLKTHRNSNANANANANVNVNVNAPNIDKTSLYVIGFNSPSQFKVLINSMLQYDKNYLVQPKKYLLNNSNDRSTDAEYRSICNEWAFAVVVST
jgi:hypothetical protein